MRLYTAGNGDNHHSRSQHERARQQGRSGARFVARVDASHRAVRAGAELVRGEHLAADASAPLRAPRDEAEMSVEPPLPPLRPRRAPTREAIVDALRTEDGNVAAAARRLQTHRTQLKPWMKQHGLID